MELEQSSQSHNRPSGRVNAPRMVPNRIRAWSKLKGGYCQGRIVWYRWLGLVLDGDLVTVLRGSVSLSLLVWSCTDKVLAEPSVPYRRACQVHFGPITSRDWLCGARTLWASWNTLPLVHSSQTLKSQSKQCQYRRSTRIAGTRRVPGPESGPRRSGSSRACTDTEQSRLAVKLNRSKRILFDCMTWNKVYLIAHLEYDLFQKSNILNTIFKKASSITIFIGMGSNIVICPQ